MDPDSIGEFSEAYDLDYGSQGCPTLHQIVWKIFEVGIPFIAVNPLCTMSNLENLFLCVGCAYIDSLVLHRTRLSSQKSVETPPRSLPGSAITGKARASPTPHGALNEVMDLRTRC